MPAPKVLSTGEMLGLIQTQKFEQLSKLVETHFETCPEDYASALKVSKIIARYAYDGHDFEAETFGGISRISKLMVDTIFKHQPKNELTDQLIKELFNNSSFVLSKLVKQKLMEPAVSFAAMLLETFNGIQNKSILQGQSYAIYGELWNFYVENSQYGVIKEDKVMLLLHTSCLAIKYYLLLENWKEVFDINKLITRTSTIIRVFIGRENVKIRPKIEDLLVAVSKVSFIRTSDTCQVSLATTLFETVLMKSKNHLDDCVQLIKSTSLGNKCQEFFNFLSQVSSTSRVEKKFDLKMDLSEKCHSLLLPACVTVMSSLSSSVSTSDQQTILNICHSLLPFLRSCAPSVHVFRINDRLNNFLHVLSKTCSLEDEIVMKTFVDVLRLQRDILDKIGTGENTKTAWANFSAHSWNIARQIYLRKGDPNICDTLLKMSVESCTILVKIDATQSASLRSKYTFHADLNYFRLKNYKEALRLKALSLASLLTYEDNEATINQALADAAVFWLSAKKEWCQVSEDEPHTVNMTTLLSGQEPWLVLKLARVETTWYRRQYQQGCDLTQSWVNSAGAVLKTTSEMLDKAMVILEQTWVFWLGDNNEDLESGVKLATKSVSILSGTFLEGLAWFWKFQCEHRLLMYQVQGAIQAAGEERLLVRKEKEGLQGEEEKEPEPTPAYPGLEISVQQRLSEMLDKCVKIWTSCSFTPRDWFSGKTMCQFMLAVAFHLQLLGHNAVTFLQTIVKIGLENEAFEEALIALTALIENNIYVDVDKIVELGQKVLENKRSIVTSHFSGLALGLLMMNNNKLKEAENIFINLMESEQLQQRGILNDFLRSRAKVELSKIMVNVNHDTSSKLVMEGPLEMAFNGWQLCQLTNR